jgi:DNA-binding response OmpR family regulator
MVDVIYIDDDDTEVLLFQVAMSARGVQVLSLPNAYPDSLQRLAEPVYRAARVVFFDLMIGTVSGLDLGRSLRQNGDNRPFFLVTAANNPNPVLLDQLQITFLPKPLDFNEVAALVHSLA